MNTGNARRVSRIGSLPCWQSFGVFVAVPFGVDDPGSVELSRVISPGFWPLIILVALGALGVIVVLEGIVERRSAGQVLAESEPEIKALTFVTRSAAIIAFLYILFWAIGFLGIVVASICAILTLTVASGERRIKFIVPIAVILPVALYYFFVFVANVPMPLGLFENLF